MKAQKKNRSLLKVRPGKEVRWEQPEEAKELMADLKSLHLEFIGAVEAQAMGFVKMAAYRANTQCVYVIVHDDAQQLWLDIFSFSKADGTFFSVTNASGPVIGLVAQRPTYFVSHRLAKTPPKALYREFLRLRPKRHWDEASIENLPLAYEAIVEADSKWQEENLQGTDAEKVMQKLVAESYGAAKSLRRSDPVSELRHLLHDLRKGEPPKLPSNLTSAATTGNLEMVKLFLKNGSDLYERTGYGFPLSAAAQFGQLEVVDYLLSQGADPARENSGMSPISKAAGHGHGRIVLRLLKAGVPEEQRKTALENAKKHKHTAIVRLLQGEPVTDAELAKPSKSRKSSLKDLMDESMLLMGREPEDEPLPEAEHANAKRRVLELLENEEVKGRMDYFFKDRDTYYGSYLGLAIKTGDMDLVKKILPMSPHGVISQELLTATEYANMEAIELLLAAGANPNPSHKRGYSALMVAAGMGNPDFVRRLIEAGSDPKFRTEGGETAMTKACGPFQKEIESLLKAAVATPKKKAVAVSSIKTRGKSKGDPATAKGCGEFRDALYSGQPEWAVACIEAPCAAVADAFARLHPKTRRHADTANHALEAGLPAIMIFQLKGQPWTILVRTIGWLEMEDLKGLSEDAKALSAALKTRAITYMAEDTSCAEAYEIFDKGKSIENACQADEFEFKSSWRKKPKFGDHFPEPTFTDLGIYLPEIWLDNDGYNTSLVLGGIKAEAVGRLDCFEMKPK
jgi:ankyrin repeat protein